MHGMDGIDRTDRIGRMDDGRDERRTEVRVRMEPIEWTGCDG
jgi:hypothetical protein